MTTGPYWDVSSKTKPPLGPLDVNAKLDIPWNWSDWLAPTESTIASFTLTPESPLIVVASSVVEDNTIVLGRIGVDSNVYDPDLHLKRRFDVTCHIVSSTGEEEDQTLSFKIVEH